MPPRWMMQREMRFVPFSRAVPPMSLEGTLPGRIMKSWPRVGASSGFWIALSQPLWKAEAMKRSLSHQAFASRPSVFVGLLARMVQCGRVKLIHFVIDAAERDPSLATRRFAGTTLLHFAAGAGCLEVVALLLRLGVDPNIQGRGDHTPLYCVANECASETGPEVVRVLARAGADVNACGGVTRATALHMAARRGHVEIARALLDSGAAVNVRDRKGDTPLQRAINCRKNGVSQLLLERGAR